MSEGTENAEAQKPSKYKGFRRQGRRVRPEGRPQSTSVLEEIIETKRHAKTSEIRHFRGLFMPVNL